MINAIIFDFGRVISSQKPQSLFHQYETDLGLPPDSINRIMFDSPYWQQAMLGLKTEKEFWYAIGPELGLLSPEKINEFRHRYYADESVNEPVVNLIRNLQGRYKLGVLSNNPPGLRDWLASWGILGLFDDVFCSGDEGMVKPDPKVYHSAVKRLDVLPHEAIFIDDTSGHVDAARKFGLHSILFTTAAELELELNRLIVPQKVSAPSAER